MAPTKHLDSLCTVRSTYTILLLCETLTLLEAYGAGAKTNLCNKECSILEVLAQLGLGEAILLTGGAIERMQVQMIISEKR